MAWERHTEAGVGEALKKGPRSHWVGERRSPEADRADSDSVRGICSVGLDPVRTKAVSRAS